MKKVLIFGTFDILHSGHLFLIKKAKEKGDLLEVVVSLDETVEKLKKQKPFNSQTQRKKNLETLEIVHKVHLGNKEDKLKIVELIKPDIICLGYDQTFYTKNLKEKLLERNIKCEIITITESHFPNKYKSSLIRKTII